MAVSLPNFPSFDVHADGNAGPRWKKWLARLERLFIGMNITVPKRKRALLLHYAGPDVDEIFDTLQETGEESEYNTAVAKLNKYFNPQVNTTYECTIFDRRSKKKGNRWIVITPDFVNSRKHATSLMSKKKSKSTLYQLALHVLYDAERYVKTFR